LILLGASGAGVTIKEDGGDKFTLNDNITQTDIRAGDAVIACDPGRATILKVTSKSSGSGSIVFGYDATIPDAYHENARVAKLSAHAWYIGTQVIGGENVSSLYRQTLYNDSGTPGTKKQEIVRNVIGMELTYLESGEEKFVGAGHVSDWNAVEAVHITVTLNSAKDNVGADSEPLERSFSTTVTIRNR